MRKRSYRSSLPEFRKIYIILIAFMAVLLIISILYLWIYLVSPPTYTRAEEKLLNDFEKDISQFKKEFPQIPGPPQAYYSKGMELMEKGDAESLKAALREFKKALSLSPKDLKTLVALAALYPKGNDKDWKRLGLTFEKALNFCNAAILMKPDMVEAYRVKARLFLHTENWQQVEATVKEWMAHAQKDPELYYLWGFSLLKLGGEGEEIIRRFKDALTLGYERRDIYLFMGDTFFRDFLYIDAIEYYREAMRDPEIENRALTRLGKVFLEIGKIDDALKYLKKGFETDPQNFEAKFLFANISWRAGRDRGYEAARLLREVFEYPGKLSPPGLRRKAGLNLGLLYIKEGEYKKGEDLLNLTLKIKGGYIPCINYLGMALYQQERYQDALKVIEPAGDKGFNHPFALNLAGLILAKLSKVEDAIYLFKKAIQYDRSYLDPYLNLLDLYIGRGEYDEMGRIFNELLTFTPPETNLLFEEEYYPFGDSENMALSDSLLGRLNRIKSTAIPYRIRDIYRGILLHLSRRYTTALACFKRAIRKDPQNGRLHFIQGMNNFHLARWKRAVQDFKNSLLYSPDIGATPYYLGLSLLRMGKGREAISAFDELPEEMRWKGLVLLGKGMVFWKEGDMESASKYLLNALKTDKRREIKETFYSFLLDKRERERQGISP